jgi:signal transduction histidine kinase
LSIRARLTVMHASLFAVGGTALIAIVNWRSQRALPWLLVHNSTDGSLGEATGGVGRSSPMPPLPTPGAPGWEDLDLDRIGAFPMPTSSPGTSTVLYRESWANAAGSEYWRWSIIALVAMVAVSVALGWWMAGRMLGPVGAMIAQAQAMNGADLGGRFDTSGPADEIADLARTFNAMLARIEAAFASERQLVANMSHELRTPLATQRTVLELAITDDAGPVAGELAVASRIALDQNRRASDIIDAMLVLARAGRAGNRDERLDEAVDLTEVVVRVVDDFRPEAVRAGVDLVFSPGGGPDDAGQSAGATSSADGHRADRGSPDDACCGAVPGEAVVMGDGRLIERLVANLVGNAVVHNVCGGVARVWVSRGVGGRVCLGVVNSGPVVAGSAVARLVQPFQRVGVQRTGGHRGQGLGLAVVDAVAVYHGATLAIEPREGGGLDVTVVFPLGRVAG